MKKELDGFEKYLAKCLRDPETLILFFEEIKKLPADSKEKLVALVRKCMLQPTKVSYT